MLMFLLFCLQAFLLFFFAGLGRVSGLENALEACEELGALVSCVSLLLTLLSLFVVVDELAS